MFYYIIFLLIAIINITSSSHCQGSFDLSSLIGSYAAEDVENCYLNITGISSYKVIFKNHVTILSGTESVQIGGNCSGGSCEATVSVTMLNKLYNNNNMTITN